MAAGKIRFTGCQSLLTGRTRAYRVQNLTTLPKEEVIMWRPFPKDTVLLILALLTLPRRSKLFRAAAEIRHRGGSLSMQANILVGKERLCTPKKDKMCTLKKQCDQSNYVNFSAKHPSLLMLSRHCDVCHLQHIDHNRPPSQSLWPTVHVCGRDVRYVDDVFRWSGHSYCAIDWRYIIRSSCARHFRETQDLSRLEVGFESLRRSSISPITVQFWERLAAVG